MNASPSSVLTLGLGSWGSSGLLLTLGLGTGEEVADFGIGIVEAIQCYSPGAEVAQSYSAGAVAVQCYFAGAEAVQVGD